MSPDIPDDIHLATLAEATERAEALARSMVAAGVPKPAAAEVFETIGLWLRETPIPFVLAVPPAPVPRCW